MNARCVTYYLICHASDDSSTCILSLYDDGKYVAMVLLDRRTENNHDETQVGIQLHTRNDEKTHYFSC